MTMNLSYKEFAYLLGCYVVVADKEINKFEVAVLDEYMPLSKEDDLYRRRMEIFSDDDICVKEKDLI